MDSSAHEMLFSKDTACGCLSTPIVSNHDQQPRCNNIMAVPRSPDGSRDPFYSHTAEATNSFSFSSLDPVLQVTRSHQDRVDGPSLFSGTRDRQWVIGRIEAVFAQQVASIMAKNGQLAVTVKLRPKTNDGQSSSVRQFRFPGKSERDAWSYTVIIRILELIYEALIAGTSITKRDIYYRDPGLFSKQAVVDRFVDHIAYTFGVPRLHLNVVAAAKGLIAGNFIVQKSNGAIVNGRSDREGFLISSLKDDDRIQVDNIEWVLIVEKEATFHTLVSALFCSQISSHGLLVTGKGYPDIATRLLLRSICHPAQQNNYKQPPVYGLMDYDPDGMAILSTYKHGSLSLAHEQSMLELPRIQWLGLNSRDIGGHVEDLHHSQGLLGLSGRDRRKATLMLQRGVLMEQEPEWRLEMQIMLFLNLKAEIQVLDARPGGLAAWLASKGL